MDVIKTYFNNLINNLHGSFARLKPEGWIRLIWIVGANLLLRPYLMKLGERQQKKQHEAAASSDAPTDAEVHPNELRSGKKAGKKLGVVVGSQDKPGDSGKKAKAK